MARCRTYNGAPMPFFLFLFNPLYALLTFSTLTLHANRYS